MVRDLTADPMATLLQMMVLLGPVGELLGEGSTGGGDGVTPNTNVTSDKNTAALDTPVGAVQVHPDRLSCGQMLLAAVRTFASQKALTLARELEGMARQLGWVFMLTGSAAVQLIERVFLL